MRFGLFRAARNAPLIARLHGDIVAGARQPALYRDYGVADTFEGRFELMALHAGLLIRHLAAQPAPGPSLARDLADAVFAHFDGALRESGVGDVSMPRKMKDLTQAYLGRNVAYDRALRGEGEALEDALARNALAGQGDAPRLARYVEALLSRLAPLDADAVLACGAPFPDAALVA